MLDYELPLKEHPSITAPIFYQDGEFRRIIHQVWDWQSKRNYIVHLYITCETNKGWQSHHFLGKYRAITVLEIVTLLKKVGFMEISVLEPSKTGYHQPIIKAVKQKE